MLRSPNMFLRKRVRDLPPTVGYVTSHSNSISLYATGLSVRWPAKQREPTKVTKVQSYRQTKEIANILAI